MIYKYPTTAYITYISKDPNLAVRYFLSERLGLKKNKPVDNEDNGAYTTNAISADMVDGSLTKRTEPLIMARAKKLDYGFKTSKYYTYVVALDDLDPGYYTGLIEARRADTIDSKGQRIINEVVDTEQKDFQVEYSEVDRVACVGKDSKGQPVHRTLLDMQIALYSHLISSNNSVAGTGEKDLVIAFPHLQEGEEITLTYKDGDKNLIGSQYTATIVNIEGEKSVRILKAPYGKYLVAVDGDSKVINHL